MSEEFDRVQFICPACGRAGVISAVYVNLTSLLLEGVCPPCGSPACVHRIDLLRVDHWLNGAPDAELVTAN